MPKIQVEIEATEDGYEARGTSIHMKESERYTNMIQLTIGHEIVHVNKGELRKTVSLLCD